MKCPEDSVRSAVTKGSLLLLSLAVPWSLLGKEFMPGTSSFGLIVLFDVCILSGILVNSLPLPQMPPLPPLLGMLLAGIALRNIPLINIAKDIDSAWSVALRSAALSIILVKAGLELDASNLKSIKGVCLRLTVIPCLVETAACSIFCYLILKISWIWGLLLGFVLGAVTPAVIVPSLLQLQKKGYGTVKGIPTLVIAASSFDDVLAITGFSVVLSIAFSLEGSEAIASDNSSELFLNNFTSSISSPSNSSSSMTAGEIALLIIRGPLEMIGGVLIGACLGFCLWFIPSAQEKNIGPLRGVFVLSLGVIAVLGSQRIGFPGSGALIAIVTSFIASFKWKTEKENVSNFVGLAWKGFEPFLFGLIGAEINFGDLDRSLIGNGIVVLFLCLFIRSVATYIAVCCAGFNVKEKIFVCFAWIPKATVQAALGAVALNEAKTSNASVGVRQVSYQILTITVLAIVITAPLGAAAIALSGPKLLGKPFVKESADSIMVELESKQQLNPESNNLQASNSKETKMNS